MSFSSYGVATAWKEEGHDGKEKVITEFRVSQYFHRKTVKMNKEEQEEEEEEEDPLPGTVWSPWIPSL